MFVDALQILMDLQKLSAGVYYIQLQEKEKGWWHKMVLQKWYVYLTRRHTLPHMLFIPLTGVTFLQPQ